MPRIRLASPADTEALGARLAGLLEENPCALLLTGPLGAGKTALTGALVRALPGGEEAEPSSPSFTICNVYPTRPRVLHCDLYRLGPGAGLPDEALEALDEDRGILVAEWAEYLAEEEKPLDALEIAFDFLPECGQYGRALTLEARGLRASAVLAALDADASG